MIMLHLVLLPCIYIQPIRPLCSPLLIHYSYVQYWNQLLHEGKTKLDPFFFFFFYYSSPCYAVLEEHRRKTFSSSIGENGFNIYSTETVIFIFFFFLLKSKEDQGIKVFIKLSYVRRFLQQIFILFFIFFPERVYPRRYIFHFYRNCTVPNVTFIIGN